MSTKHPFDPISMWKTIYEQTEANWSGILHEMMEREDFSENMGDTLNHYLQYQELVSKMTETYLKEVNMPSRSEVANIASLIINLEEKVDFLSDELDDNLMQTNQMKDIKHLQQTVNQLDEKMSSILSQIELMNQTK